jgi:hypothetical protein
VGYWFFAGLAIVVAIFVADAGLVVAVEFVVAVQVADLVQAMAFVTALGFFRIAARAAS